MINRHPESDLMVEYATGSLPLAHTIAVTTHLQFCEECRNTTESLKDIGGDLLQSGESIEVSDGLLDRILDCIESGKDEISAPLKKLCSDKVANDLPDYVSNLLPEGNLEWRKLTSSLRVAPVSVGEQDYELSLHRINPGGKAPKHYHRGREITVVLKGSFSDEDGVYQPGDFIVREHGDTHRPFATRNEECICLSVLEAPIRLTGLKSVLNPFLSFSPS